MDHLARDASVDECSPPSDLPDHPEHVLIARPPIGMASDKLREWIATVGTGVTLVATVLDKTRGLDPREAAGAVWQALQVFELIFLG